MKINKISDRINFNMECATRYVLLKDNTFAVRFMKNQFKNMAPLDRMLKIQQ